VVRGHERGARAYRVPALPEVLEEAASDLGGLHAWDRCFPGYHEPESSVPAPSGTGTLRQVLTITRLVRSREGPQGSPPRRSPARRLLLRRAVRGRRERRGHREPERVAHLPLDLGRDVRVLR